MLGTGSSLSFFMYFLYIFSFRNESETSECRRFMANRVWIRWPNFGCWWSSSSFVSTRFSSQLRLKLCFLRMIMQETASTRTEWTVSSIHCLRRGSMCSVKAPAEMNLGSRGQNWMVARRTRQVASLESLTISGTISLSTSASPIAEASLLMFYMRDTLTSVTESFMMATTGGSTYYTISSLSRCSASSQMAWAIEPLTCWL
jgi:hypothetical protein